jgi:hypothetical protein
VVGRRASERGPEWPLAAFRCDRAQARELVDADLRVGPGVAHFAMRARISVKAAISSIGSGKTIVVFWLTPISSSVCR